MKGRRLWIYPVSVCLQLEVCEWNQGKAWKIICEEAEARFCLLTYLEEHATSICELDAQEKRVALQLRGR